MCLNGLHTGVMENLGELRGISTGSSSFSVGTKLIWGILFYIAAFQGAYARIVTTSFVFIIAIFLCDQHSHQGDVVIL